jgi:hypothetical protein
MTEADEFRLSRRCSSRSRIAAMGSPVTPGSNTETMNHGNTQSDRPGSRSETGSVSGHAA